MDQLLNLALVPSIETPPESEQLVRRVNSSIRRCLSRRENTIETLKMVADEIDDVHKTDQIGSSIGSGMGIAGGVATIVGGALTFTGAGAIIGVPLCMWGGFGAGLAGGGVKFGFSTWKEKKEENYFKKLIIAFERDQEAFEVLHKDLERLMKSRYSKLEFSLGLGLLGMNGVNAHAQTFGVKATFEIISKLLPKLHEITFKNDSLNAIFLSLLSFSSKLLIPLESGTPACEIAMNAVKDLPDGPTKTFTFQLAKSAANNAEPIAQQAAAEAAVKKAQKIASKVAGSFTMFIGFVTTFFEIHGLAKKLAEESLGQEIRTLAEELEISGNNEKMMNIINQHEP